MAELNFMQRQKQNGYRSLARASAGWHDSLIENAKTDRQQHELQRRNTVTEHRCNLIKQASVACDKTAKIEERFLSTLNDEGVELIWAADDNRPIIFIAIMRVDAPDLCLLASIIDTFKKYHIVISHVESRLSNETTFDIFFRLQSARRPFLDAIDHLEITVPAVKKVELYPNDEQRKVHWFPICQQDLDHCVKVATKYEPEKDPRHPGHGDQDYCTRRAALNDIAFAFRFGDSLPEIEYRDEETQCWREVYTKLKTLYPKYAYSGYLYNLKRLEEAGIFSPNAIPNLHTVDQFLNNNTGFRLRPCGGLLSARDFLASLALRTFQCTLYTRFYKHPHHSPEPDVIHEYLGHVPMLADAQFAQFSQDIGLASLGASDEDIEKLATVYWFIIEFGLCREQDELRVCGAGLLSAYGEMLHAIGNVPERRSFEPHSVAVQKYDDNDYQPVYYVADSIQDAMDKLRAYAHTIERPFSVFYDPFSRSIRVCNKIEDALPVMVNQIQASLSTLIETAHISDTSSFEKLLQQNKI